MASTSHSNATETSEKFYRFFQSEAAALQQHIDRLGATSLAGGEWNDATEYCMAGIQRLSHEVKDASVYIPARDQQTYLDSLKNLSTYLQQTREAYAPKPKFTFKSAQKRPSAMSLTDAAQGDSGGRLKVPSYNNSEMPSSAESSSAPTPAQIRTPPNEPIIGEIHTGRQVDDATGAMLGADEKFFNEDVEDEDQEALARKEAMIRKMSFSQAESVHISRQSHSHIILPPSAARATTTGTLTTLRRCVIDMSEPTGSTGQGKGRPFAGLTLKNIKESLVVCGRVAGALHVTKVQGSVIAVACRQFRMHECKDCDVYIQVGSRPIIEDCTGIRFAPLPDAYKADQQADISNLWDQVDDFKWLRTEPSPNWNTLPAQKQVGDNVWTQTVPGAPDQGVSDILAAVGVRKS